MKKIPDLKRIQNCFERFRPLLPEEIADYDFLDSENTNNQTTLEEQKILASKLISINLETNPEKDAYLRFFLSHQDPRIRANALEAISRTEKDPKLFLSFLQDQNNRVIGNAILWFIKNPTSLAIYEKDVQESLEKLCFGSENSRLTALYCMENWDMPRFENKIRDFFHDPSAKVSNKAKALIEEFLGLSSIDKQLEEARAEWEDDFFELERFFPAVRKEEFDKLILLRKKGDYKKAIEFIKNQNFLENPIRFFILGRLNFEVQNLTESRLFFERAIAEGFSKKEIFEDIFLLESTSLSTEKIIQKWQKESEDPSFLTLAFLLQSRIRKTRAIEVLEAGILNQDQESEAPFSQWANFAWRDLYAKYYGFFIMILQVLLSCAVLFVTLWHLPYAKDSLLYLAKTMISGQFEPDSLKDSMRKVLPPLFLLLALGPVIYINLIMILSRIFGRYRCFTELHDGFLRVQDFFRTYHLSLDGKHCPLYVYEDDTDYTYISLIRHLPFVPNLCYVYGWDQIRNHPVLLPLYGVPDGSEFLKLLCTKGVTDIRPMNMLGVRLAQIGTFFSQISSPVFFGFFSLIFAFTFIGLSFYYYKIASTLMYILGFCLFGTSLFLFWKMPLWIPKILDFVFLRPFFRIHLIRTGILALLCLYLSQHYFHQGIFAIIPVCLGIFSFYFLFVRSRYLPKEKGAIAEISAFYPDLSNNRRLCWHSGQKPVFLGKNLIGKKEYVFASRDYFVIPVRFLFWTLFYEITLRSKTRNEVEIIPKTKGFSIRFHRKIFHLYGDLSELKKEFEQQKISFLEVTRFSPIPLRLSRWAGSASLLLWILWNFTSESLLFQKRDIYSVQDKSILDKADSNKDFIISNGSFYLQSEEIFYRPDIDTKKKIFAWIPQNPLRWMDFERRVKTISRQNPKDTFDFLPPFVKKDGFRDDVIDFVYWNLWKKFQIVDPHRYFDSIVGYCRKNGLETLIRNQHAICGIEAKWEEFTTWAEKSQKLHPFINANLLSYLAGIDGRILKYADDSLKDNKEVVYSAVLSHGSALFFASERLKKDFELAKISVYNDPSAYRALDDSLKKNNKLLELWSERDFVKKAISKDGTLLEFASQNLRSDREIIAIALSQSCKSVSSIHENLLKDTNFLLWITEQYPGVYSFLSPENKKNKDLIFASIKKEAKEFFSVPSEFKKDSEFVLQCLELNAKVYEFFLDKQKEEKESLMWLKKNPKVWDSLSEKMKTMEFAQKAAKENGNCLKYFPPDFKTDENLCLTCLKSSPKAAKFLPDSLLNSINFLKKALSETAEIYHFLPQRVKTEELILSALKKNHRLFLLLEDSIKENLPWIFKALNANGLILEFLPQKLQLDREIVKTAASQNPEAFQFAPKEVKEDERLILSIVGSKGLNGHEILKWTDPDLLEDQEFCTLAIQAHPRSYKYLPFNMRSNRSLVLQALLKDGSLFEEILPQFQNDTEMQKAACQSFQVLKFCTPR